MIKRLVAQAVLAALVLVIAAPAIAELNVTIYGKFHASLDYFSSEREVDSDIADIQVSSNNTRIGFKGTEDIREGLEVVWQLETLVNFTNRQGGILATRNSFIGLRGNWGTFLVGNHDTPTKTVSRKLDPFGDTIFDARALLGSANGRNRFNLRTSNTAMYTTPSLGAFTFRAAYVADVLDISFPHSQNDRGLTSFNAIYSDGPLFLIAGFESHRSGIGSDDMARLGGSYKFGSLKLGGMVEQGYTDDDSTILIDRIAYNVYAILTIGLHDVAVQVTQVEETENGDNDAFIWSVSVSHGLTDRTKIYLAAGQLTQGDGGEFFLGAGHNTNTFFTADKGSDQSSVSIGMVHHF